MNAEPTIKNDGEPNGVPGVSPDVYSTEDFRRIARLAKEEAGIAMDDRKVMLAYSRLAPMVRESGCETFSRFLQSVEADAEKRELVVAALTTNHTYFFREPHHFAHFAENVRPALVKRLFDDKPVRLWSAGCSSGDEAWSLAMVLLGADRAEGRRIAGKNIRLLASDFSREMIEIAQAAQYPAEALTAVPEQLRNLWTTDLDGRARIADVARELVRCRRLNLLGDWPMKGLFDVVLCRNVTIYFDQSTREALAFRMAEKLAPGGHLYIGHSERVSGPALDLIEAVGPTIYRRRPE